ncbi:MAG: hypothetical protein ABSE95_12515 [Thermodesulfobacteriota bacterium]|jgi:hypothetical protein
MKQDPINFSHEKSSEFIEFRAHLIDKQPIEVVQICLFDSPPYCFADNPFLFQTFRKEICDKFEIHPQNFTIVGSAKLGFSLNPEKIGQPFTDGSDIDVVLVSEELFQNLWVQLIEFQRTVLFTLDSNIRQKFDYLQKVLFFGIIRLDKLSNDFPFAKEWWEFFNKISTDRRFGPRRVRAAIFKTWKHASFYYEYSIKKIKEKI